MQCTIAGVNHPRLTRRQLLKLSAAAGVACVGGVGAYGTLVEPFACELTERDVFIENLPTSFDGFRIAQLSDVHHSNIVTFEEVRRAVEIAQRAGGDLVALTGDYTTLHPKYIEPCVELLKTLTAPAGVWAVLGNHDHFSGATRTREALMRAGIELLTNRWTEIERGGDHLALVGVDDWSWGVLDWERAQSGLDTSRPSILLSHQPRVLDMEPALKHSLILSGHTHGGQISFPFIGAPARFKEEFKYISGLFRRQKTQLFVTRGTGVVGLPVRLGAPPEISVIRLRRSVKE